MKKAIALILMFIIALSTCIPSASAADTPPVYDEVISTGDTPGGNMRAANPPYQYRNLSAQAYTAKLLDLAATKGSYTVYYFSTSTGAIHLSCYLERSGTTVQDGRILEARLYNYDTGRYVTSRTFGFTGPTANYTSFFSGLDVNTHYYIYFYNASSTDVASEKAVSGTIVISESR